MENLENLNLVLSVVVKCLLLIVLVLITVVAIVATVYIRRIFKRIDSVTSNIQDKVEKLNNLSFDTQSIWAENIARSFGSRLQIAILKWLKSFISRLF